MTISGSLQRLAERNGLVQISFKSNFRNIGQNDISIIGLGFTAFGIRYTTKKPARVTVGGMTLYQRDARTLSRTRVYELTELTNLADKRIKENFTVSPGEVYPFQSVFLVRKGRLDAISLYSSVAYARGTIDGSYQTKITRSGNDAVYLVTRNNNGNYYSLQEKLGEITLW